MNLRTVLVAAAVCAAESFAPQDLPQHPSELRAVAAAPELKAAPIRTRRKRLQVQQLERQYQRSPSHHTRRRRANSAGQEGSNKQTTSSSRGLTRDEEVAYTHQIRTFRAAMRLREQLVLDSSDGPQQEPPSTEAWAGRCGVTPVQLRRILRQGQAARTAVVDANIGLVTKFAKRQYHSLKRATTAGGGVGTILTLQDMIQEGNLGLMEAAERFEPEKGFRFSTYATWWVRQRILRSISDSSRTIRLPAHVHSMLQKMRKAKAELKSQTGREPTTPELASHLDVSEEKLQLYAESSRNVVSLERPLHSASFKEDERTLGDTLASDAPTPEEDVEADYLRRDIRAVMATALVDKERAVIVNRFGLEDGKPRSVSETAQSLGLTRDRVRLVEARALNKLRHPQRNYKLKEYIHGQGNASSSSNSDGTSRKGKKKAAAGTVNIISAEEEWTETNESRSQDRIWFF